MAIQVIFFIAGNAMLAGHLVINWPRAFYLDAGNDAGGRKSLHQLTRLVFRLSARDTPDLGISISISTVLSALMPAMPPANR
jgi:hypothetical protein